MRGLVLLTLAVSLDQGIAAHDPDSLVSDSGRMTSGGDRFVQLLAMPQLVDSSVLEASRPASRVSPSSLEDEAAQRLSFSRTGALFAQFLGKTG